MDKSLQPKQLKTRHRVIMEHLLAGMSQREVARKIGMSESRLSIIVNTDSFQRELSQLRSVQDARVIEKNASAVDEVNQRLREEALKSVERLVQLRDTASSEPVQRGSATDILDRAGYQPKGAGATAAAVVMISGDLAKTLNVAAEEARALSDPRGADETQTPG